METLSVEAEESIQNLLREQHGDIRVVIERQSEINRRLGLIEGKMERLVAIEKDVEGIKQDLESDDSNKDTWWGLTVGTAVTVLITLAVTWAAAKLGLPIVAGS